MKRFKITVMMLLAGCALFVAPVLAQEVDQGLTSTCPTRGSNNYITQCIDGYEWMAKFETVGCIQHLVPIAQKLEIVYKRNGTPRLVIPVPCEDIEVVHIPAAQ